VPTFTPIGCAPSQSGRAYITICVSMASPSLPPGGLPVPARYIRVDWAPQLDLRGHVRHCSPVFATHVPTTHYTLWWLPLTVARRVRVSGPTSSTFHSPSVPARLIATRFALLTHDARFRRPAGPLSRRLVAATRTVSGFALAYMAGASIGWVSDLSAQQGTTDNSTPGQTLSPTAAGVGAVSTRADLQALVAAGGPEGATARQRLADGDFHVGDRIARFVQGEPALTDTVAVREGLVLHLANIPDISLHGVLRSELRTYLTTELGRYLRSPVIRAVPLVRVAVLGPVGRPGFYSAPADELLTDLMMQAGGPTSSADVSKTVVRRAQVTVQPAKQVQMAMKRGETLDQLDVRPGDEVVVGEKPPTGHVMQVIGVVSGLIGVAVGLVLILRR
jgi:protein involved in polysaccharide export with SLBB domain